MVEGERRMEDGETVNGEDEEDRKKGGQWGSKCICLYSLVLQITLLFFISICSSCIIVCMQMYPDMSN